MSKFVAPRFEPLPYYMSAMGMQGARFLEGDTSGGVTDPAPVDPPADPAPTPPAAPAPPAEDPKPEPKDDELGDNGKKALESERNGRKQAEKDLAAERAVVTAKDAEIMSLNTAVYERDQTIAAKDSEIAVLTLAVAHGLSDADDMDLLRSVTDDAKRASLAERLAKDSKHIFRGSGLPGPSSTSGSLDAGRELHNLKHNKSRNS